MSYTRLKCFPPAMVGVLLLALCPATLPAQSIFSTLTGVVADPGGAVVPSAKVILKDARSGSVRESATNNDGYYTFASVPAGLYELTVSVKGFDTTKVGGIDMSGGEKRNINVNLKIATSADAINVVSETDLVVPVDSGVQTNIISSKQLDNFIIVGSNAAEFIKIMPGFGISNGTNNKSGFSGEVIGINGNGDGGSQSPLNGNFSYNGLPTNSLDITADGAHVSDPGCNCATPVNPNSDFISEFQVKASNFSAEDQKGPIVASSISKAGGREFHGSAFFYARNAAMNANDAVFNASGQKKPENKYYYPGFTFGGPVVIPGTNFNKKRDKLFFFTGYEYFYQVLDTGLLRSTVPTAGELTGNFTAAEVAKEGFNVGGSGNKPGQLNSTAFPSGIIPASQIDKNMVALMNLYPKANADPNSTGGYNYVQAETFNQNSYQWSTRVDYSISDNTKLFVKYNLQREVQQFPVGLWWRQNDQVPYPTPVEGRNRSDQVTASLTHVFSPTMTNEFVFAYTYIGFPNVFQDPSKVDRSKVGYGYAGLFKNGVAQIPSFGGLGWTNQEASVVFNPGGFEAGGASQGLYADKWLPSVSDTLTKVWGVHTVKTGFFWEHIRNSQPANNTTNGQLTVWNGNSNTLGNEYADLLTGNLNGYNESNFNRINDIGYTTAEGFIQDSWKVTKKLTLELGLRVTHFTPWGDNLGFGYSTFDRSKFNPSCAGQFCGFQWNKLNSNVPIGGFPTRALFYQPRFGIAFSPFKEGKTVFRGGWGRYYYHSGQFTNGLDAAAGVKSIGLGNNINGQPLLASNLSSINVSAQAASPSAVDSSDDRQAYTQSYSFTISQRTPWSGLMEVAYVGNSTRDLASTNKNINLVPIGALLSSKNGGVDPNSLTANNYRPLLGYAAFNLATNNGYSNYNAIQTTWVRTKGKYVINANYTFGKALGITGYRDQYNLDQNYGELSANRKHIFNTAYSVELGNPLKGNKILGGVVNGWQLSGLMQIQSGANLTGNSGGQNFGASYNNYKAPGLIASDTGLGVNASNVSLLGTSDIQLNPIITCNPTSNLGKNQFINPNCFAIPKAIGQNGPTVLPAIYGPSFFNADLGMFKNFQIKEQMKVQLRFNAYNFLNHPLWSFYNGNNLQVGFNGTTGAVSTPGFGTVTDKQGHRVIQVAAKFFF